MPDNDQFAERFEHIEYILRRKMDGKYYYP